ncbi:hypothetical protein Tco_1209431 [Tanacetum coccineum]
MKKKQHSSRAKGYKVNADGLKVCPDKADAVLSLPSPGCLKDVQLNEKLASLNKFLSKSAEKSCSLQNSKEDCTKKIDFNGSGAEIAFRTVEETHRGSPNAEH